MDGKLSGPFATTKGLRQEDGLACLLFILALERAIRDSRVETTGTIFYKSTQILAYADDIDIIGLRLSYVADAYQGIEQAAENLGLQINEAKAKLMVATSAGLPINNQNLTGWLISPLSNKEKHIFLSKFVFIIQHSWRR